MCIPALVVLSLGLVFSERRWRSQKMVFRDIAVRYSMKSMGDQQCFRSCGFFRNRVVMCGIHRKKPRLYLGRFIIKIAILINDDLGVERSSWQQVARQRDVGGGLMAILDPDWARVLVEDGWVVLERSRFSLTTEELEDLMTLACDISLAVYGHPTALSA